VIAPPTTTHTREWVRFYRAMGLRVVPIEPNSKGPKGNELKDWQLTRMIFEDEDFPEEWGIGLLHTRFQHAQDGVGQERLSDLGASLVVVDLDSPEAVAVADDFLPKTPFVWGRASKIRAKRVYVCAGVEDATPTPLKLMDVPPDDAGQEWKTLVELRFNHQDVLPPSLHDKTREPLSFSGPIDRPADVEPIVIVRATRLIGTAALITRHYPGAGGWHAMMLALLGTLRHLGLSEDEARRVLTAACRVAGDPLKDPSVVRSTYQRADDAPLKSEKALTDSVASGKKFVQALKEVWGLRGQNVHGFTLNAKESGVVADSQHNVKHALKKLKVQLSFNAFSGKPIITQNDAAQALDDAQINRLRMTIDDRFSFRPSKEFFRDFLDDLARRKTFHPVRDYLKTLTWDGMPRLDAWLITYANAADTEYTRAVSRLPLLAAVRRVMAFPTPVKFDEMLVLESAQGKGKSTALSLLCPFETWFGDDLPLNVDAKQVIERTSGKWIIEAQELAGGRRADIEHVKSFLSRRVDGPVRLAYGHQPTEVPRQFVIIGTTNSHAYLKDMVNRRFWPVRVDDEWDLEGLARDRDQLWAEAYARERKGEAVRLHPSLWPLAALQQERRRIGDPWELHLRQVWPLDGRDVTLRLTWDDVWNALGKTEVAQRTSEDLSRASAVMQQLGFKRVRVKAKKTDMNPRPGAEMGWGWDPPQESLALTAEPGGDTQ
jgi:predicted P-loop ATPase